MSQLRPHPDSFYAHPALALLLAAFVLPPCSADILTLRNGKRIEGCVTAETPEMLTVKIANGEIQIPAADLYSRITGDDLLAEYNGRLARATSRTVDQLALAQWCKLHCLTEQQQAHARKVLERDPAHALAREMLGFTKAEDGTWRAADGGLDPYAGAEDTESESYKGRQSGGARQAAGEFLFRWTRVDKTDAEALRSLGFFCRSENLATEVQDVLRALFAVIPDDKDGLALVEHFKLDMGVLRTKGMSDVTFVRFRDGRELLGKATGEADGVLNIDVEGVGVIGIPQRDIDERRLLTLEESEYYQRSKAVGAADEEGHLQLAMWCKETGLGSYALKEAQVVIGINKDNAEARAMAGFVKRGREWVSTAAGQDLGDITESGEDWKRRKKEIQTRCATLLELLKTGGPDEKMAAGKEALEMRNPYVVPVLLHILVNERGTVGWLASVKTALHEIQNKEALDLLVAMASKSKVPEVVRDSIEVAGGMKTENAAVALVELLAEVDSVYYPEIFLWLDPIPSPTVDAALKLGLQKTIGQTKEHIIGLCGARHASDTVGYLIPNMTHRNPFEDATFAALVEIGYPGVPLLIESLKVAELRKQTVKVLRTITGETIPISYDRWLVWWNDYTNK